MGYRTYHSLTIHDKEIDKLVSDELDKKIEQEILENTNGDFNCDTSWYDMIEEMCEFSKKYPDYIFQIDGTGDDSEDLWTTYFRNGKYQECPAEITYPPYNPDLLVPYEE